MFGHPGISALEFAGEHQEARKTLSLKGKAISITTTSTTSTSERVSKPAEDQHTTELESPQLPIQPEEISLQRRRLTFMNHTPRNFEMRSPKRTQILQTIKTDAERQTLLKGSDETLQPGTSHQPACGQAASPTSGDQTHHSALGILMSKNSVEVNTNAPIEPESKEMVPDVSGKSAPESSTSRRSSSTSSMTSRITGRASTAHSSLEIHPHILVEHRQSNEQTPYKIVTSSLKSFDSRSSPLEPWAAHPRRQETSSTISDLPLQMEIDSIAEVPTFGVVEYFDSQVSTRSAESTSRHRSSSSLNIPLPSSPAQIRISGPPVELVAVLPTDELGVLREPVPDLPLRSPARLHTLNRVTSKTVDADFASAAEGQYSPYDKRDAPSIPRRRSECVSVRLRQTERTGSSTLGRMAPPILGHVALAATADLNELSLFLKNTGPPLDEGTPEKKPALIKIFTVARKKSLAMRVRPVEGNPSKNKQPPPPACARQMKTASGARHLRIVVPTDILSYDHTITSPISLSTRRSSHISLAWTDEMLNPLASVGLEHAMSDLNSMDDESHKPPATPRTPKCSPISLTPVPVEDHPLNVEDHPLNLEDHQLNVEDHQLNVEDHQLNVEDHQLNVEDHPLTSREEKTKARKLRDLKRRKRNTTITTIHTSTTDDTTTEALATPDQSPVLMRESPIEGVDEQQEEWPLSKMVQLQHKFILLQRQNTELAEALASMMGLEMADGNLEADVVLKTYKRLSFSRDTEWGDMVMGRN